MPTQSDLLDIACRKAQDRRKYQDFLKFQQQLKEQKFKMEIKPRNQPNRMMAQNNYDPVYKQDPKTKLYIPNGKGGFVK